MKACLTTNCSCMQGEGSDLEASETIDVGWMLVEAGLLIKVQAGL